MGTDLRSHLHTARRAAEDPEHADREEAMEDGEALRAARRLDRRVSPPVYEPLEVPADPAAVADALSTPPDDPSAETDASPEPRAG